MNAATPFEQVHGCPLPQPREQLLAAAAQASRLLLESNAVLGVMPEVLRLLGEAADVDRTTLALAETDERGERWLVIKAQWTASCLEAEESYAAAVEHAHDRDCAEARRADCFCNELTAGRSVYVCPGGPYAGASIASGMAKSSIIVPFMIDGQYAGAVGFDSMRKERQFDSAVISALEIAASVLGAALQREQLVEAVRREREAMVDRQVAELARANAALRANLERLAREPADFFDHLLVETTRHVGATCGGAIVQSYDGERWHLGAFVCDGKAIRAPFADTVPQPGSAFMQRLATLREPLQFRIEDKPLQDCWPEFIAWHRDNGFESLYLLPLVFGERNLGCLALGFRVHEPLGSQPVELLEALGQQLTLALAMKRFAWTGKQAAVLAERNRIGQEIHDGLAQAFTGILMQLGAAEAIAEGTPLASVLNRIRDIAREGLTEARRSVLALRPDEQRTGGLELALRQLAERSTVSGRVESKFEGCGAATGLPPEHEHALLRIAQEAVSNAVRHARPRNVEIRLQAEDEDTVLSISDDGCGMRQLPGRLAQHGFGLTNMRERAEAIGGRCHIESGPGQGTRVTVRVPRGGATPSMVPIPQRAMR
jgi:signal transduction histidine kinase